MTDLLALAAELVAVPSPSRGEGRLAAHVAALLEDCPWLAIERVGDNVVARTTLARARRVLVAGHLDTVPAAGNEAPRVVGDTLWGLGAADMKGGLAVMVDLARTLREPALDVTWCFYAREEIDRAENGLVELWATRPDLLAADAAVLAEPTGAVVEAGCQGTVRCVVHLGGVRAHTSRPFAGTNAIHRLAPALGRVAAWEGRRVELDGCLYVEQLQAVAVAGGVAPNVVPDEATLTLNHRFAPDRTAAEAAADVAALFDDLLGADDHVDVVDAAEGAPPALGHPILAAVLAASGAPPAAKQAWTDVATMAAHGVPATNLGPGDPLLAHRADEHVSRASLQRAHRVLAEVLSGRAPAAGPG